MTRKYYTFNLVCPYCSNVFEIIREEGELTYFPEVVSCNIEETDGCDRYFAVKLRLKPVVTETYKMIDD